MYFPTCVVKRLTKKRGIENKILLYLIIKDRNYVLLFSILFFLNLEGKKIVNMIRAHDIADMDHVFVQQLPVLDMIFVCYNKIS